MMFDLRKVLASKRKFRGTLAARPIAEKLRLLDELRERAVILAAAGRDSRKSASVREDDPDIEPPRRSPR
jgi:hypothetical protein